MPAAARLPSWTNRIPNYSVLVGQDYQDGRDGRHIEGDEGDGIDTGFCIEDRGDGDKGV